MTTTFLLFDIRTTVGPLEVYLQNLESLRSLRNLSAFEAEGFEAFEIGRFSMKCPEEYVFDVCEVCENQKRQKNVSKEYTLEARLQHKDTSLRCQQSQFFGVLTGLKNAHANVNLSECQMLCYPVKYGLKRETQENKICTENPRRRLTVIQSSMG